MSFKSFTHPSFEYTGCLCCCVFNLVIPSVIPYVSNRMPNAKISLSPFFSNLFSNITGILYLLLFYNFNLSVISKYVWGRDLMNWRTV
jgi:hypothetical protein